MTTRAGKEETPAAKRRRLKAEAAVKEKTPKGGDPSLKPVSKRKPAAKKVNPYMLDGKSWNKPKYMALVCEKIATSTKSLVTIMEEVKTRIGRSPDYVTVRNWIADDEEIGNLYARAKEDQADFIAEEMIDIADDGRNDYMESVSDDGKSAFKMNGENVQRSRLRLDTRKWLASKLRPKKYGDKLDLTSDGKAVEVKSEWHIHPTVPMGHLPDGKD